MNCTKGKIVTLGDVWEIFKEHGLDGSYCPHCDQFAQARVLQKQDELISDMYEALMEFPNHITAGNMTTEQIQGLIRKWRNKYWHKVLAKADGK